MKLEVFNSARKVVGSVDLPFFDVDKCRYDIIHMVLKWQIFKSKSRKANTKLVSEVNGSTRKIYRQKGTGSARHGSRKRNIFRGGAPAFGPRSDQVSSFKVNKKIRKLALQHALVEKNLNKELFVIDGLPNFKAKTKNFLKTYPIPGCSKLLFVDQQFNEDFLMASRNLHQCRLLKSCGINVYDVFVSKEVYITQDAIMELTKRYES